MRSLSGTRNRVILLVVGLLALVAAMWLAAAAYDLAPEGGPVDTLVPDGGSTPASLIEGLGWVLPVGIAICVVAVLGGIAFLLAQIPTAPTRTTLRLHGSDGTVMAQLEPQVLEHALVERVEDVQGVESASVRVSGSAAKARVVAEVAVAESAEIAWTVEQVRMKLYEDLRLSLGAAPRSVDVLITLRGRKPSSRDDRVAVGGEPE